MFKLYNPKTAKCIRDAITGVDLEFETRDQAEDFGRGLKLLWIDSRNLRLVPINVDMLENVRDTL